MFGGVFGYTGVSIGALAQARVDPGGKNICTFCVLGDGTSNIQNGNLSVTGGNMWFNGNVDIKAPNGSRERPRAWSRRGWHPGGGWRKRLCLRDALGHHQSEQAGADRAAEDRRPPGCLPAPLQSAGKPADAAYPEPLQRRAGIYGAYKQTTGGPCSFDPGLYVFTGDFELGGSAGELQAKGVTFYFTCQSPTTSTPKPVACGPGTPATLAKMAGASRSPETVVT